MLALIGSLLLSGEAAAADTIIYYNASYASTSSLAQVRTAIMAAGGTVSFSSSTSWPSSASSYSGYKLVMFVLPGAGFSGAQANALETYVASGGRVVFVGEYELRYSGACLAGYCTENDYIDSVLTEMGSDLELGESPVAYSGCATTTSFGSDQLTDGVSSMVLNTANTVANGISVVEYGGSTVVAVDQSSSTSHARTPYDIVVVGDYTMMTTTSYGGCTGAATEGKNYTFWYNLYDGTLCQDDDGDGYTDADCGGSDCDDTTALVYPGALERCDDADNDCDGTVDEDPAFGGGTYYADADGDGYGDAADSTEQCELPSGYSTLDTDCDDADADVHPAASEYCDDTDNDCDGSVDESSAVDAPLWYRDYDDDGYGRSTVTARSCEQPTGYAGNSSDCDDTRASVYPGATETCNSRDDDCDSSIDEGASDASTWYRDADGDSYGSASSSTSSCSAVSGYVANDDDCDDSLSSVSPAATESCNGRDDDCDGSTDESSAVDASTWYRDADGDSYGSASVSTPGCSAPSGYVANDDDCDDGRGLSNPAATEYCNSHDDDCDGTVDEGDAADAATWYDDDDGDGYGDPDDATDACSAPGGSVATATDCDDSLASVHPGATESCNGLDDDCDGGVDEAGASGESSWYTDADGDGWGDSGSITVACDAPEDGVDRGGDCDDDDATAWPGAYEVCDGHDDDCDGVIDDGATDSATWYADDDGDGWGDLARTQVSCEQPIDYVEDGTDCDDGDPDVNPGMDEVCNGLDDDCDAEADEDDAVDVLSWYADADGDSWGDASVSDVDCANPPGFVADDQDCDDADAAVHPEATELCNDIDDDCDGSVDDSPADISTWWYDADGDGYGGSSSTASCDPVSGYVGNDDDCDDSRASVSPEGEETCNGRDDDCDGSTDEDSATDASTWYRDRDGDSFGDPALSAVACESPTGYVADGSDCDDGRGLTNPAATEYCNDEDDDCDGSVDEGDAADARTWYSDGDGDGYGDVSTATSACEAPEGAVDDYTDCDDADAAVHPGAVESCNEIDDDCDGAADEAGALGESSWYTDADGDGYGRSSSLSVACDAPADGVSLGGDCDDADASAWPGAPEVCDGADDDCDGTVDDGATDAATWYADDDGDGWGDPERSSAACEQPIDYVDAAGDCDDGDEAVNPDAVELCNGVDDDCDDETDEDDAADVSTWYSDADGDGHGDPAVSDIDCVQPVDYVEDPSDCDPHDDDVHPGAEELCNGIDDDCDGVVDGETATEAVDWYADADGDGYGDAEVVLRDCELPEGHVAIAGDCDDGDGGVSPAADERCDGEDDDCDGEVDEGSAVDAETWYRDADGDGYGDPELAESACDTPTGYVDNADDCDDGRALSNPGGFETCNGEDDDCDGYLDEGAGDLRTFYADLDEDGFGDPGNVVSACDTPDGYVEDDQDCDDEDPEAFPGAEEVAYDGIDQDCDGADADDLDADGATGEAAGGDDCDDGDPEVRPGAVEEADGIDEDCDGVVDDGTSAHDDDGDGFTESGGDCDDGDASVHPGAAETGDYADQDCDGLSDEGTSLYDDDGDGSTEVAGDCDDGDPAVGPDAAEVADNGVDDDCDGTVDDGAEDLDGDGYTAAGGDCAVEDGSVHPGGVELVDGLDNDCDGRIDEGTTAYDDDGDGLSEAGGDCNDADANSFPDAEEVSDGRDNDCDGDVDEDLDRADDDGDGFTEDEGDCDDGEAGVYPGAPEADNGVDDDCDGDADEAAGDSDGDGYTPDDGDCDDGNGWANPGQVEMCDGADNDCDGAIDEGCDGEVPGTLDTGKPAEDAGCGCTSAQPLAAMAFGLLAALGSRRRTNSGRPPG